MNRFFAARAARARRGVRHMLGVMAMATVLSPALARATPIDLNLLFHDPGAPISITADGSRATFSEDPSVFAVFLSNVPGFGDPQLLTAASGARLAFDYTFDEPAGNADIFHFALLDGVSGDPLGPFDLLVTDTASGAASFDLSSLLGVTLGMQFELIPDVLHDSGFDSTLTITNLRVEDPTAAVEEPPALTLLLLGLGLLLIRFASSNLRKARQQTA